MVHPFISRLCYPFSNQLLYKKFVSVSSIMSKTAVVLLAEGAEEMEFVIAADVLRRANVNVTVAGIGGKGPVTCSRGVVIVPDVSLSEAVSKGPYDAVVMPGGLGGSKNLAESSEVGALLKEQENAGRIIAAICAAPTALKAHGICIGKALTSYPAVKEQMEEGGNYTYKEDKVVVDGTLITSRGPGTAFDFAVKIAEHLVGEDNVSPVKKAMLLTCSC